MAKVWLCEGPHQNLPRLVVICVDPVGGSWQIVRTFARERALLSPSEKTVLRTFRQFLVTPGRMLCFFGPNLEKHKTALQQLTKKDFLIKEEFKGAYSLTRAGYDAMKTCDK